MEPSERQALEAFVVDNDDLLALEEAIGRFNIFDALGVARAEIRHSNFLAWLLDPAESHGQGDLFLKAVLMDLLRQAPPEKRPLSPVELDGDELRGIDVRREWKNIDLLISCEHPRFVVAIENKIDSGEHSEQLQRYEDTVRQHFGGAPAMFVFLTTDSSDPSDEDWVPYSYADIHRVLTRTRRLAAGSLGGDAGAFLDHYLRLIGSRFMNDPTIDELCRRIYKNHRQAIDLIYERVGPAATGAIAAIEEVLREQPQHWHVVNRRGSDIEFVPASWLDLFPPIGARATFDRRLWVVLQFRVGRSALRLIGRVWPTQDRIARKRVVDRLVKDPEELGFRLFFKNKEHGEKWTTIRNETLVKWTAKDEPDEEAAAASARATLDTLRAQLDGVSAAVRPIAGGQPS